RVEEEVHLTVGQREHRGVLVRIEREGDVAGRGPFDVVGHHFAGRLPAVDLGLTGGGGGVLDRAVVVHGELRALVVVVVDGRVAPAGTRLDLGEVERSTVRRSETGLGVHALEAVVGLHDRSPEVLGEDGSGTGGERPHGETGFEVEGDLHRLV